MIQSLVILHSITVASLLGTTPVLEIVSLRIFVSMWVARTFVVPNLIFLTNFVARQPLGWLGMRPRSFKYKVSTSLKANLLTKLARCPN